MNFIGTPLGGLVFIVLATTFTVVYLIGMLMFIVYIVDKFNNRGNKD